MKWFSLVLLFLIIAFTIFINTHWGQTLVSRNIVNRLSKDLNTKISFKRVGFSLFNKLNIEGVLVEDQKRDTLLYAGRIQVRITDWFFFKDKAELKYIGLENALIRINRADPVWNYHFLENFFSSSGGSGKKASIEFDLKKVNLENVVFQKEDKWSGEDLLISLKKMTLDANEINFASRKANIASLVFTQPRFHIKKYNGNKPDTAVASLTEEMNDAPADSLLRWNRGGWQLYISGLKIKDGVFKNDKETGAPPHAWFDGRHIEFAAIDADFEGVRWEKDTITANLKLKTRERSGFEVKSMVADIKVNPKIMEFDNMEIITNKSVIRRYYAMEYDDFDEDMSDYINQVRMNAAFEDAEIHSDDIAFFAPNLSEWKKKIRVNGKARGTVDDLFTDDIEIEAGKNTYLNGDISLVGLPDINETFIDFKANRFRTNYSDAIGIFPQLARIKNPDLRQIQYLDFTGSFTGFIRDFVTFGNIQTNLGSVTSDLNMKLPKGQPPVYSGNIAANHFHLGRFLNNAKVGAISFDGKVMGRGFEWETLIATVDGTISEIGLNDYTYQNVSLNGRLNQRLFDGKAAVKDPNLNFDLNGLIDFNGTEPKFDLLAHVGNAHLGKLNIWNNNLSVSGNLNLNFTGNEIDNFRGRVYGEKIMLRNDSTSFLLDTLSVTSGMLNGEKYLSVMSNEFEGNITGHFSIKELPASFSHFLSKYYPAYIRPPQKLPEKEIFTFDIKTRYPEDLVRLIHPHMSGLNNSSLNGKINMEKNELELNADIPYFAFKNFIVINSRITGSGDLEKLAFSGVIDQININDSINLPNTRLGFISQNDISEVKIITERNTNALGGAELKMKVQTFNDGASVHFDSSSLMVNGKTWNIEKDGELSLRKNTISYALMVLRESNQEIKLSTLPSDVGDWNDIRVDVKNLNIGDITPYLVRSGRIEGLVTGTVKIEDPQNRMNVLADVNAEQLRWDNDSIGQLYSTITYINKTGELTGKAYNTHPDEKISLDLKFNLRDSANTIDDYLDINPDNYPVKIIERFTGTLFTHLEGFATGKVRIINPGSENIKIIGKPRLRNAALTVDFTKCRYSIDDTEIEFTENLMNFGTLRIKDRFGRTAIAQGSIRHNSFRDMKYDISVQTGALPVEMLNTSSTDNKNFYGRAKGTGRLTLSGPQSDMLMKINAVASYADSSYITIPSSSSRETGMADFLVERKYGREMEAAKSLSGETNITYDVDLTASSQVNIKVVLDELTGDEIQGRGAGNLKIRAGTNEALSIRGRYDILDGNYQFTFQSFIKKPFELKKNAGNYIEWTGDPYNATINITAIYKTDKEVSFAPIVSSANINTGYSSLKDEVYVVAKLSGNLFSPDIKFELDFPDGSPAKNDPQLILTLQQIQNNENELNKQVAYLILSDNFAPAGSTTTTDNYSLSGAVVNTITGKVAAEINKVLNNFLNRIDPNLRVSLSSSFKRDFLNENTSLIDFDRSSSNVTLGRSFFNDRFIFTFEGTLDVPIYKDASYTTQLLPNITTEVLINKSGSVRATFFYRQNVDFLTGASATGTQRATRVGASLSFRKDFDEAAVRKKKQLLKGEPKKEEE